MAIQYSASFDVRDYRHGLGSVTFSASGESDFTVDITALVSDTVDSRRQVTIFNHYPMNQFAGEDELVVPGIGHSMAQASLPMAVTQRLIDDSGWANAAQLSCEYNGFNYAFNYQGDAFTAITFSNNATRRLFGFGSDFSGSEQTVESDRAPDFIVNPVLRAVSMEGTSGYIYEASGISMAAMNMGGAQYGITRARVPIYRDWMQQSETKALTLRSAALVAHPFTHQRLFEACRSVHPFLVIDGFGDGVDYLFRLRPDGCVWGLKTCRRAGGEMDDALFDVVYQAQVLGSAGFSA